MKRFYNLAKGCMWPNGEDHCCWPQRGFGSNIITNT